MNALIEKLNSWKGREYTELAAEERGFSLHRTYQRELIDFCSVCEQGTEADLKTYWTEVARELVCSARQVKVNQRKFPAYTTYRSSYLDELARREATTSSIFPDPPLHPCLRYRQMEYQRSGALWHDLIRKVRGRKIAEIEHLQISGEGWTGLKKDIEKLLARSAHRLGFNERPLPAKTTVLRNFPSHAFCKDRRGLIFGCSVDPGRLPQATQLHLNFFVFHEPQPEMMLWLGDYRDIVPGFELYNYFLSDPPEFRVLGIRAYVELFDVFADSFE